MPPPVPTERRMSAVGSHSNPEMFLGQDYHQLHRDFYETRARFLDKTFLPNEKAIGPGLLTDEKMARVQWIRPTRLVRDPQLVVDGESRFDFAQGELGNCWFLSAIGAITFQTDIMDQIIPGGQSFRKEYAGIFHFRFWRFGRWIDVVVDDKLPTIDGQLIFVHCKTRNEFWPALLEKAYAKVCGSYADLNGGFVSEALTDFTGRVHMTLTPREGHPELWGLMSRAAQYRSIMGCGTPQGATPANTELPNGIVEGHAYTVTGVTKMKTESGESVKLLRLLNPWGHREWKGDWSDNSPLWRMVSTEQRTRLLDSKNDGEFWMTMDDFCRSFVNVDICCYTPAFLDGSPPKSWTTAQYEGCWDERTAGGSMDHQQSFWTNPQYRVKIPAKEPEPGEPQGPNLLVSLMQKPDNRHRRLTQHLHIGFSIFAIPPEMKDQTAFPASFFTANALVAQSQGSSNTREVMDYYSIRPGRYLIVPFTYKPNETTSFVLTVHSKRE
ncbi:calpain-1 catalytic subunit-like [Pygocentrus nattereri]|uniref:calpain-1 catalytic subunit-like n=1 Tax=Pygocentrus nattereri TaxID=42514 RepID=UPI001890EE20|nr:calpain-1 catalytic subunit-like [Pygocentrus nattereri]